MTAGPDDIRSLRAIDTHGHVGRYRGSKLDIIDGFYSGGPEDVLRRAEWARVEFTFVSPFKGLFTQFGDDPVAANAELAADIGRYPGLFHWVVVDPTRPETFRQAAEILKTPRCVGIKVHPDFHGYEIKEHGAKIFAFAAAAHAVLLSHSGGPPSLPQDFIPFADSFPEVTFIFAHLGWSLDGDLTRQARAVQMSRHGNVHVDTSSSYSITSNLIEWAVREIGPDKILFGSDTPLYFSPMQRARIDNAEVDDAAKRAILRGNAERLFAAKLKPFLKA
jgi:predicted TIM-barrel fold metal-dependent hydrolase